METGQVLSPEQVSPMEHVLPLWTTSWRSKNAKLLCKSIQLGLRVSSLHHVEMMDLLHSGGSPYKKAKYLLIRRKHIISVIMHKDATAADVLQSYIHALVLRNFMNGSKALLSDSQSWMDKHYEVFIQKLKSAGWKTERLLSPSITWRANWISQPLDEKRD